MGNETPMMRQYKAIKQEHQDAILFFRLGDFYEMFFDDAKEASQLLDLVLTARNGTPMCGIPYHASKTYIKRLIEHGKKVAICEQTELPESGKGLAKREVVQIITPGTVIDDDFLDSSRNNFICSIACHDFGISCSYADMSTGDFRLTNIPLDNHFDQLRSLLQKILPVELLIQESYYFENSEYRTIIDNTQAMITRYPDWYFSKKDAFTILTGHFNTVT
jgi:DNA mismatch repair protein MutS